MRCCRTVPGGLYEDGRVSYHLAPALGVGQGTARDVPDVSDCAGAHALRCQGGHHGLDRLGGYLGQSVLPEVRDDVPAQTLLVARPKTQSSGCELVLTCETTEHIMTDDAKP
jgi:hypothetical protein